MSEFIVQQVSAPENRYVLVTNDFARGHLPVPLTALQRVLLLHLFSLPTGWRMSRSQLDKSVTEGRDAVSKALRGLEAHGYLRRDKKRDKGGTWRWTWSVTRDPVTLPLPSPSPENQSMDATSGNSASPQVAPSTDSPATVNQSISTEDGEHQKTDTKTDFQGGTPVGACAGAHADPRSPIHGRHLVGLNQKALTQKLTSVWSAVVKESGGTLPIQDGGGWDVDGSPLERGRHPIGSVLKAWLEANPSPVEAQLDDVLTQLRRHAMNWATKGIAA